MMENKIENNYEIIAKFKDDGKEYFIILINQNKVLFTCYENNKLRTDLTYKEFDMVNSVYQSLKVNVNTSIKIEERTVNNKIFNIYYDINSKNFFWRLKNPDQKILPEDNVKLNFIYNHVPYILDESDNSEEENIDLENNAAKKYVTEFFNKTCKTANKLIAIEVAASIALIGLTAPVINTPVGKQSIIQNIVYGENAEYNFEDISNAIENNPNLTREEKNFINKFKFIFDKDHQLMDLEMIKERLGSLKIEYINESSGSSTSATYNTLKNVITIYEAENFATTDIRILTHEIGHVFQDKGSGMWFASELSNELWTQETLRKMYKLGLVEDEKIFLDSIGTYTSFGVGYGKQMPLYYILASMIPKEELNKFQYTGDEKILVDSLAKHRKVSSLEIYKLLLDMDKFRVHDEDKNKYKLKKDDSEIFKNCYDQLNKLHKKIKGKEIKEDLETAITYYIKVEPYGIETEEQPFVDCLKKAISQPFDNMESDDMGEKCISEIEKICIIPKTYLSDDAPEVEVKYKGFNIYITDENLLERVNVNCSLNLTDDIKDQYENLYRQVMEMNTIEPEI